MFDDMGFGFGKMGLIDDIGFGGKMGMGMGQRINKQ
jgi:hypothetical protein